MYTLTGGEGVGGSFGRQPEKRLTAERNDRRYTTNRKRKLEHCGEFCKHHVSAELQRILL